MKNRSLFVALLGGPLAWTIHLFALYLVVALWCSAGWSGRMIVVIAVTGAAALAALISGSVALRFWREGKARARSDPEPGTHETWDGRLGEYGAREMFVALLAMFMALLFAFLIVVQGVSPILSPDCHYGVGR